MSIKSMINTAANVAAKTLSKGKFKAMKNSPEILVVAGVIGVVASTVMACKATLKAPEVLNDAKENLDAIHDCAENPKAKEKYTDKDRKRDLAIVYTQTGVKMVKLYAPAVIVGSLSIASILMSHNILRKRNAALAAAYTALDQSFKSYRKRVIEKFGDSVDKELRGLKAKEIEEKIVGEDGNEQTVKKTVYEAEDGVVNQYSPYARFYDDGCKEWTKDAEYNLTFLRTQQNWANEKLRAQGYLFLNEVYRALGIPETKAGQIVGWTYDLGSPNGDNFVDFGIYDIYNEKARDFVNGYERTILLDFNVDGNILDLI